MKLAAARAIAGVIGDDELHAEYIVPSVFNRRVVEAIAASVADAAVATGVARRTREQVAEQERALPAAEHPLRKPSPDLQPAPYSHCHVSDNRVAALHGGSAPHGPVGAEQGEADVRALERGSGAQRDDRRAGRRRGRPGLGAAEREIRAVEGRLSDHYDPRNRTLNLSPDVGQASTVAALGVAAHEAGHAIQDARGYWPMRVRQTVVPVASIGSSLAFPLIFLGFILGSLGLVNVGLALFTAIVLFQLITLPVEFDASRRALVALATAACSRPRSSAGPSRS